MYSGIKSYAVRFGEAVIGSALLGFVTLGSVPLQAASVSGSLGLAGAYSVSGGSGLSDATTLDLLSALAVSADGDLAATLGLPGTINNSPFSINPTGSVSNLLTIGGWQIDITSFTVVDQTVDFLTLEGTGGISGNGFDLTPTQWTLSAQATGGTYSMALAAIPVPAAVWLFGSGLLGLAGLARRKKA